MSKKVVKELTDREVIEIEEWAKSLTESERRCPVVREYLNTRIIEHEAYSSMHNADGIVGESVSSSRL